jgi:hypothetical protein
MKPFDFREMFLNVLGMGLKSTDATVAREILSDAYVLLYTEETGSLFEQHVYDFAKEEMAVHCGEISIAESVAIMSQSFLAHKLKKECPPHWVTKIEEDNEMYTLDMEFFKED